MNLLWFILESGYINPSQQILQTQFSKLDGLYYGFIWATQEFPKSTGDQWLWGGERDKRSCRYVRQPGSIIVEAVADSQLRAQPTENKRKCFNYLAKNQQQNGFDKTWLKTTKSGKGFPAQFSESWQVSEIEFVFLQN